MNLKSVALIGGGSLLGSHLITAIRARYPEATINIWTDKERSKTAEGG